MKNDYTIHEIAELYGIGPDALRYYERLGLIRPKRAQNGYRLYSLVDIYRLTIIRDLRELDFSMERIGDYLDGLSLNNTITLLEEERALIRARIKQLRAGLSDIDRRVSMLKKYAALPTGDVFTEELSERACVSLNANITRDEEVDLAIKKLHHRHADTIRALGGQIVGAKMDLTDIENGVYGLYRSVFILPKTADADYDFALPAGRYARLFYRGSYRQCKERVCQLLDWTAAAGFQITGGVLELCHIDNRYTLREEEFVTELQARLTSCQDSGCP